MGFFHQLKLVLWKNFLNQKRQILWTFFELCIPLIFTAIFVGMRQVVDSIPVNVTNYQPFHVSGTVLDFYLPVDNTTIKIPQCVAEEHNISCVQFNPEIIFYAPSTKLTDALMTIVGLRVNMTIQGFDNEANMTNQLLSLFDVLSKCNNPYLGGVVFDNSSFGDTDFRSTNLTYTIRLSNTMRNPEKNNASVQNQNMFNINKGWNTNLDYPVVPKLGPREAYSTDGGKPGYFREGFLTLQRAIDAAIATIASTKSLNPEDWPISNCNILAFVQVVLCSKDPTLCICNNMNDVDFADNNRECEKALGLDGTAVELQRFSYPPYLSNPYISVIQQNLPMLIMLSFIISALYIIRYVTIEKEKRLKEYMRVMGLSNLVQWVAYFILNLIKLLVAVIFMSVTMTVSFNGKKVMDQSDGTVVFVFLLLYAVSTICYCFTVSVFFKKGNSAAAFGGVIWFALYVPYFFLQPRYASLKRSTKFASSLFFSTAMSYGAQIIGIYEGEGVGIQWSNINIPATKDDNFTMVEVWIMMLIDSGICLLITWYVEAVFPGDEGVSEPWYFPVTMSYWCPNRKPIKYNPSLNIPNGYEDPMSSNIEEYPEGLEPQVVVNELTKIFGKKSKQKIAVNKLSLKMYPGQTTALLGHNGAGKSTTMSMLTGMMSPTSGTAYLNGCDIRNGLYYARKYIGLCPQYNPLFDNLTVLEHLKFFCQLKDRPLLQSEVDYLLTSLGLKPKIHSPASTLSGGMKRKLCLCIALIGGSEIVMLDEPTSGMDPSARHEAWHLLQQEKKSRTILLTTHYMEEADLLSDRIAILAHGHLRCFGSSLFLKRIFGAGYHLTVVFKKLEDETISVTDRAEIVLDCIRQQVEGTKIESAIGAEATFILPAEHRDKYQTLFAILEASQENLAVTSFGVSVTTMEEVFLRVAKESEDSYDGAETPSLNIKDLKFNGAEYNTGCALYMQQFRALLVKRALHSLRNWMVLLAQLVIPAILLIVTIIVNNMLPGPSAMPALMLNLDPFLPTVVGIYNSSTTTLYTWYENMLSYGGNTFITIPNGNIETYVLEQVQKIGEAPFDVNHIIGAMFGHTDKVSTATAFFNNQPYHGPGITLNAADNAMLANITNGTYRINTINHPLPPSNADNLEDWIALGVVQFNLSMFLMFGMAFLSSSFVVFLIKERTTKSKHLQLLGGLPSFIFWLSTFFWDFLNYMVTAFALMFVFGMFKVCTSNGSNLGPLLDGNRWLVILLILILYGWAVLPMMYCASFAFKSPSGGFVLMTIYNIITGMIAFSVSGIFYALELRTVVDILHWIFTILFPTFCLGQSLDVYYMNNFAVDSCKPYMIYCTEAYADKIECCKPNLFATYGLRWKTPGIGQFLFFLIVQGIVGFLVLILIECRIGRSIGYVVKSLNKPTGKRNQLAATHASGSQFYIPSTSSAADQIEDEDVAKERQVAMKSNCENQTPVVVRNVTKYYGSFLAVNKVNFVVCGGECFGLLGVNGAGKTSTFQMLTGENPMTGGDAFIAGQSIKDNWRKAGRSIGYCPQFDALVDQMTGRETLVMFARLKGISEKEIGTIAGNVLEAVGIAEHGDKQVKTYSGGTKRKLSLGVGLIGAPSVLLLDEPTSGVDPASRRIIWNVLGQVRQQGVAVVLTSHSMEECEALCTRLAIMVDGRFKCLGSLQHLKNKRGSGYTLLVKLSDESFVNDALTKMEINFPGIILKEIHQCQLHFHIPTSEHRTWSSLFGTLERLIEPLHIVDYSLTQTTLEQIFLNFLLEKKLQAKQSLSNPEKLELQLPAIATHL